MNKIEQKKAAIDLTGLAVGIVILGIAVSIGAVILNKMAASQIVNAATNLIANESVSVTTAGTQLSNTWFAGGNVVLNASNNVVIASPNYSISVSSTTGTGTITNSTCVGAGDLCVGNWKVSYSTYNTSDVRYALPNKATVGLAEYGNWFKILVIVGVAAVVLALIFMAFGNRANGETGGQTY